MTLIAPRTVRVAIIATTGRELEHALSSLARALRSAHAHVQVLKMHVHHGARRDRVYAHKASKDALGMGAPTSVLAGGSFSLEVSSQRISNLNSLTWPVVCLCTGPYVYYYYGLCAGARLSL